MIKLNPKIVKNDYGQYIAEDACTLEVHTKPYTFDYCLSSPILSRSNYYGGGKVVTTYHQKNISISIDSRSYNPLLVQQLRAPPSFCLLVKNYTELNVSLYTINPRNDLAKFMDTTYSDKLPSKDKDVTKQDFLG